MRSLVGCFVPRLQVYLTAFRARPPKAPRNLSRLTAYDTWTTDETPAETTARARELLAGQRRRVEVYTAGEAAVPGDDDTSVVSAEKG